jgi:uncharacterized repeat protein (TIGR02543 family)
MAHTYYVRYDGNGGDGEMSDSSHAYGTLSRLSTNAYTKTGYTFTGWNTEADGGGTPYGQDAELTVDLTDEDGATVRLWAQWTEGGAAGDDGGNDDGGNDDGGGDNGGGREPIPLTIPVIAAVGGLGLIFAIRAIHFRRKRKTAAAKNPFRPINS